MLLSLKGQTKGKKEKKNREGPNSWETKQEAVKCFCLDLPIREWVHWSKADMQELSDSNLGSS